MTRSATKWVLVLLAFVALPAFLGAQVSRPVTGHVITSETMQPLAGVQVVVKGTNIGTLTDDQGNFSLQVPVDATTLVFTYLGYEAVEAPIQARMDVTLRQQAIGLEGIVVTALGVQREKRSLGYSIQDVKGEDLNKVPQLNIVNALQGSVAGVHITNAGPTGGTARIVIHKAG